MSLNYRDRIPNNVDLGNNRSLQRALEHWQPKFLTWWQDLGPEGFQAADVYLRTATSVDAKGWATYGKVKMPDYRWGIFLAEKGEEKTIGFDGVRFARLQRGSPRESRSRHIGLVFHGLEEMFNRLI